VNLIAFFRAGYESAFFGSAITATNSPSAPTAHCLEAGVETGQMLSEFVWRFAPPVEWEGVKFRRD
jgi:hypothetical protein